MIARVVVLSVLMACGQAMSAVAADLLYDADRQTIRISGPIEWRDPCLVVDLLVSHPAVTTVYVDSAGGDAWAGVQLARVFADAELTAVVPPQGRAMAAAAVAVLGARRVVAHGRVDLADYAFLGPAGDDSAYSGVGETQRRLNVGFLARETKLLVGGQAQAERAHRPSDRQRLTAVATACHAVTIRFAELEREGQIP